MHFHCGTNNRAPQWTFTDPCKPEVRPGAREESASPDWLAAPAVNACPRHNKGYIYGDLTLDVDRHYIGSVIATTHQEKGIMTLESNLSRGTVLLYSLLYTGSHGVVSIRHNFVCNHKRCRFLVFRNFA